LRVLVTGAHGFIGAHVVAALRDAGHLVTAAVREPRSENEIACDFASDLDPAIWLPRLARIDAVVNCAGILRESTAQPFSSIHVAAPLALFRACERAQVRRVIQISALGLPEDGEFIASKHRADEALARLDLDWTVLRPGLVFSATNAYGGTSLLRALAVLPLLLLPAGGKQHLRPLAAQDVGAAIVAALARDSACRQVVELVGPQALTLREYLCAWRAWFGLRRTREIAIPQVLVDIAVRFGETFTRGPLCRVIANLLQRERIGAVDATQRIATILGIAPRSLAQALRECPSREEDRWRAQLYILLPLLRVCFALVWLGSGLVGLVLPVEEIAAAVPGWPPAVARALALTTSIADLLLGALLLCAVRVRAVEKIMLAMLSAYTVGIGVFAPMHWLDPFGGLLKNIALLAALAVLIVLESRE
jgi:uncharacterized protein YbjT (DUF2867 family)/uncharacterized membrane protein YphA (DoxX/SURF4 family)